MLFLHKVLSASSLYIHWHSRLIIRFIIIQLASQLSMKPCTKPPEASVSLQFSCQEIFIGKLQLANWLIQRIRKIRNPFQHSHINFTIRAIRYIQQRAIQPCLASYLWRSAPFPGIYNQSILFERFCCKCQSQALTKRGVCLVKSGQAKT